MDAVLWFACHRRKAIPVDVLFDENAVMTLGRIFAATSAKPSLKARSAAALESAAVVAAFRLPARLNTSALMGSNFEIMVRFFLSDETHYRAKR